MKASDKLSLIKTDRLPESGYVYLINADGTDRFKIGKAKDVKERITNIRSASPLKIKYVFHCYVSDAYKIERELHKTFSEKRVIGEWFALTLGEVKEAVLLMKLVHEQEPTEQEKIQIIESELIDDFINRNSDVIEVVKIVNEQEEINLCEVVDSASVLEEAFQSPNVYQLTGRVYTPMQLTKIEVIGAVGEMRSRGVSETKIIEQLWQVKKSRSGWSGAYREYKKELGL